MSRLYTRRQVLGGIAGASLLPYVYAFSKIAEHISGQVPGRRKNVFFIAVDDLRTELGCYGRKDIISPNIDKLASEGILFEYAYCQQAVCSPSRTSLMTGLRPDTCKVTDLVTNFRDTVPDVITLPQYLKDNGYYTESIGKIFHKEHMQDDKNSWSVPSRRGGGKGNWQEPEGKKIRDELVRKAKEKGLEGKDYYYATLGPPTDMADVPDNSYDDGVTTDRAVESLQKISASGKPFFLAVGYIRPHLPFSAPKKYWDLYDPNKIKLPDRKEWPDGTPEIAKTNWGELRGYYGVPKEGPVSDEMTRKLIHGYHASVSYTDAQVGRLMTELEKLKLKDDTIIILWGDHGWKLGEYGAWCKHTAFEIDTRAPLILCIPGYKGPKVSGSVVEFLDIYPTLVDECSLPIPEHCQGRSMRPILEKSGIGWKNAAFSQWPSGKDSQWPSGKTKDVMGYSLRTPDWRYTEWIDRQKKEVVARELYDHRQKKLESVNLADKPEYAKIIKKLSKQLAEQCYN